MPPNSTSAGNLVYSNRCAAWCRRYDVAALAPRSFDLVGSCAAYISFFWLTDWGLVGVWLAMLADFVVQGALVLLRFHRGKWKHVKV